MYLKLGQVPTLVVSSAEIAKQVMKSHDLDLCTRPALVPYKKLSYNFTDIAFTPHGEYWREIRKISVLELFSVKRVKSFGNVREEEVASLVRSISQSSALAEPINLSEMLPSLTFKMLCRVAFGKSYEGETEGEKERFRGVLQEASVMLGGFFVEDFLPWMWWMDVMNGLRRRLERSFLELDSFYERLIEDHLHPRRGKGEEEKEQEDFIDVMLRVQRDLRLTREHIKGVLMNVLIAGTESNATTIMWAMTELVRKPSAMKKVQDEMRRIVGKKGMIEESDLHQLDYFKLVMKEILRLHPPGPLLVPREAIRQCSINGYVVSPKTRIYINAYAIGRDPKSWENPNEFLPERFIDSSIDYKGQDFELIPFGGGRRSCPAIYFATMNVELVLANLLYSFDWELPDGMKKEDIDVSEAYGITVQKKYALKLVPRRYSNWQI
jgi:aldoxime dehydratase